MSILQYINLAKFRFISRNAKCYRVDRRVNFMENIDYDTTKAKMSRGGSSHFGTAPPTSHLRDNKRKLENEKLRECQASGEKEAMI